MTPDEAIAKLRGLPEDKQRQVLAALGPDERKGILAKLSTPSNANTAEPRTIGNYLKEGAEGIGRGLKGDVLGALQMATKPRETASQFAVQAMGAPVMAKKAFDAAPGTLPQRFAAAALTGLENAPVLGPMVQHAEQGGDVMGSPEAFGAALEGTTSFMAPEMVGKGVARVIPKIPDAVRAATGTGARVVGDLVKETKAGNEAAAAKASEENAGQEAQRKVDLRKHFDKTQEAQQANEKAEARPARKEALNRGVERLDPQLKDKLKATYEKVKAEANRRYDDLALKLNNEPVNTDVLKSAMGKAADSIKGSNVRPEGFKETILKSINDRVDAGDSFTYKDLQGYREELGNELSKGSLPGDVYHAYKDLQETITNEMQRIADAKGEGGKFRAARSYYRNYAETFLDRDAVARKALTSKERGGVTKAYRGRDQSGIEKLARYNPDLAQSLNTVRGYQAEAAALPAKPGKLKSLPKLESKPKPAELTAPLNKVRESDVRAAKTEGLNKRADWIENRGALVATWPLFHVMSSIMHGDIPNLGNAAVEGAVTYGAARGFAQMLRNPKVADFLTRATPADVAQIPPDLRGDFPSIVQAAQKQGIRVSPALIQLARAGAVVGQTKKRVAAALQPQ